MSSSATQVFVPMVRTEEEPHRQLAHSTPSSPETAQLYTAQHQFVIFIVFVTSPAQPSPAQHLICPASAELGSGDSFP